MANGRKRRSRFERVLKSPTLVAFAAVVGVVMVAVVAFVVLTWIVFRDRYGVGFADYVRNFLF